MNNGILRALIALFSMVVICIVAATFSPIQPRTVPIDVVIDHEPNCVRSVRRIAGIVILSRVERGPCTQRNVR